MLTPYRGAGPFDISREYKEWSFGNHTSRGVIYKPVSRNDNGVVTRMDDGSKFPAIVFGHGLCAKPEFYEHMNVLLSSWGYVVLATEEFSDCDVSNFAPGGEQVNTTAYTEELERNVLYLASGAVGGVNASAIALAGHSMGGGASINAAVSLEDRIPGLVKAVVAVAPWNGVEPNPSTRIPDLGSDVPVFLICSTQDSLVPCSGPITTEVVIGSFRMPFASLIPAIHGRHHGVDWNGGVLAMYENATSSGGDSPAVILAVVKDANHLTIVDTDGRAGGTKLAEEAFSRYLEFPKVDLERGAVLPTIEYSVAFLEWVMRGDAVARDLLWGEGIQSDARFRQPVLRSSGED
ncbi:hypothetical protein HOP50_18g81600 [Chloropicon primus]|nr:hypothetical protein HOP50_18g81600 [Chloropicon primus]